MLNVSVSKVALFQEGKLFILVAFAKKNKIENFGEKILAAETIFGGVKRKVVLM